MRDESDLPTFVAFARAWRQYRSFRAAALWQTIGDPGNLFLPQGLVTAPYSGPRFDSNRKPPTTLHQLRCMCRLTTLATLDRPNSAPRGKSGRKAAPAHRARCALAVALAAGILLFGLVAWVVIGAVSGFAAGIWVTTDALMLIAIAAAQCPAKDIGTRATNDQSSVRAVED